MNHPTWLWLDTHYVIVDDEEPPRALRCVWCDLVIALPAAKLRLQTRVMRMRVQMIDHIAGVHGSYVRPLI